MVRMGPVMILILAIVLNITVFTYIPKALWKSAKNDEQVLRRLLTPFESLKTSNNSCHVFIIYYVPDNCVKILMYIISFNRNNTM